MHVSPCLLLWRAEHLDPSQTNPNTEFLCVTNPEVYCVHDNATWNRKWQERSSFKRFEVSHGRKACAQQWDKTGVQIVDHALRSPIYSLGNISAICLQRSERAEREEREVEILLRVSFTYILSCPSNQSLYFEQHLFCLLQYVKQTMYLVYWRLLHVLKTTGNHWSEDRRKETNVKNNPFSLLVVVVAKALWANRESMNDTPRPSNELVLYGPAAFGHKHLTGKWQTSKHRALTDGCVERNGHSTSQRWVIYVLAKWFKAFTAQKRWMCNKFA